MPERVPEPAPPINRLMLAIARFLRGPERSEAVLCGYCRKTVAPFEGERSNGQVFCDEECSRLDFERLA
jgi:hypothetical protein